MEEGVAEVLEASALAEEVLEVSLEVVEVRLEAEEPGEVGSSKYSK